MKLQLQLIAGHIIFAVAGTSCKYRHFLLPAVSYYCTCSDFLRCCTAPAKTSFRTLNCVEFLLQGLPTAPADIILHLQELPTAPAVTSYCTCRHPTAPAGTSNCMYRSFLLHLQALPTTSPAGTSYCTCRYFLLHL